MKEEKMIEKLFDKLFSDPMEKSILKVVINERDPDKMIEKLIGGKKDD